MQKEMSNKKFKDTRVGKFLKEKAPGILDQVGNVLPDKGVLGIVKNLIDKDPTLPPQDKETAMALLQQDNIEMQEVTKRCTSDMESDSWLSKNTRPLALIFLTIVTTLIIIVDSTGLNFEVKHSWVMLLETLLVTVYVAYFGSRGAEKFKSISKK
jgi:hypothetical protein